MIIGSQMMTYDGEKMIDALVIINNFYAVFFPKIFKHVISKKNEFHINKAKRIIHDYRKILLSPLMRKHAIERNNRKKRQYRLYAQ